MNPCISELPGSSGARVGIDVRRESPPADRRVDEYEARWQDGRELAH